MVKNKKGGSGHKRQARKHTSEGGTRINKKCIKKGVLKLFFLEF